ncbi:MAG: phosphotransferase family protein [Hyphomicrobiaceae bacterium]|nr:phosphotransferase family protein [Hyphomicrobiaceae bacterium]
MVSLTDPQSSAGATVRAPLEPTSFAALCPWLAAEIGAERVEIANAALLAGGAVQQNWRLDVAATGGPRDGTHAWVLRTDAAASLDVSLDRLSEFRCIEAAHRAGVMVAEPIAASADVGLIGRPFAIQALVAGNAQARRIVRDPDLASFGDALAGEIGRQLALIHAVRPAPGVLTFLPVPIANPSRRSVAEMRKGLDGASEARPAIEYILSWLDANAPDPRVLTLVHGDFRTGNYMVDRGRLTAVLDWEFCHWGDPREDLGWFIARCWRFGNDDKVAGGIARLASLLEGYNAIAEAKVTAPELAYFEVLAAARWAVISLLQGDRFVKDGERSLELALTGLMPPEMEWDALDIIDRLATRGRVT